jgi:ABC-type polysaccharide/polyol phosphate transport system ATPase subunit
MEFIAQSCDKILVLQKGSVLFYGSIEEAIKIYMSSLSGRGH